MFHRRRLGYLVSGTAVGSVCLWRLDHVSDVMIGAPASATSATAVVDASLSDEVVCRVLTSSSDEGVKHLFIRADQSDEPTRHGRRPRSLWLSDCVLTTFWCVPLFVCHLRARIFAVIGDQNVKIWGSWHDPTCQLKKFDRPHDYRTCKETFTLRHELKILVLTVNTNAGFILDLETMIHTPVSACESSIHLALVCSHL
jgi:hypothetical protein